MPKTAEDLEDQVVKQEELSFEEDDTAEVPPPDIIAYNELRSCADLYRMYSKGILDIQPNFQREIVWPNTAQTRFVDSLINQLPIPSMCFSLDYKTEKWQVIDGLQRMATIIKVLSGEDWVLSKLDDVNPKISGKNTADFHKKKSELHDFLVRIENLTLPVTVLRSDYSKKSHTDYMFTIFHRLNSGGLRLTNQEIRNCIYSGSLNDLLNELNEDGKWLAINKMNGPTGYRFRGQELILRFFAFHDQYREYRGKLARFLNEYMDERKSIGKKDLGEKREVFEETVMLIHDKLFETGIPTISVTVLEALMVGISMNLAKLNNKSGKKLFKMFVKLQKHPEFSTEQLSEGLSGKQRVVGRMNAAQRIFSGE